MTVPVGLPNYDQLHVIYAGDEDTRGTKPTIDNKWYGKLQLDRRQPLADSDEYAGTFFADYTPVRGPVEVTGSYNQPLAYEDLSFLPRYGMQGGITPTDDGNTTHGYLYTYAHTGSRDDLDSASIEYGTPGMMYDCSMLMFPEFTISADIDDAQSNWKWSSRVMALSKERIAGTDDKAATGGSTTTFVATGWGLTVDALAGAWVHFKTGTAGNIGLFREVLSNTSTTLTFRYALPSAVQSGDTIDVYGLPTAGIADRTREMIKAPGTLLYLDTGTIGTTLITGRFLSFSITSLQNLAPKRFMENTNGYSNRLDRGMVRVSGQIRLEFDRKREWENWKNLTPEKMRIKQTGSVIDSGASTNKYAQIDVLNLAWDSPTEDKRGNNITVTLPFRGYVDPGTGVPFKLYCKTKQSSLLA